MGACLSLPEYYSYQYKTTNKLKMEQRKQWIIENTKKHEEGTNKFRINL